MSDTAPEQNTRLNHPLISMRGRAPNQSNRPATTLELLFDLTFVIAISAASSQFAHLLGEGHYKAALSGFGFAMFAVIWAWINFSWFASAFDTDDWLYRLTTMVQMIGVLILALGLPAMFSSIDEGRPLDNGVMVAGYVVMRVAMIAQWWRVAKSSPAYRRVALMYVRSLAVAQLGWIVLIFVDTSLAVTLLLALVLFVIELGGPFLAETRGGGTPWNPEHIAERYGLLVIIALGEEVVGTVATLSAVVDAQGWTWQVVGVAVAGIALTFGMWWMYFALPTGEILTKRRQLAFPWGYSHMFVFAAVAAVGAGLHVAALYLEDTATIGPVAVLAALAIPVFVFIGFVYAYGFFMFSVRDPLHIKLLASTVGLLALSVLLTALGVPVVLCLLVAAAAPAVSVVGFERAGNEKLNSALSELS